MPRKHKAVARTTKPLSSLDVADADQLFTVEQTARFLAISDWMVRKQIRSELLPSVFIEGLTRIRAADIREFISERRHCADDAILNSA